MLYTNDFVDIDYDKNKYILKIISKTECCSSEDFTNFIQQLDNFYEACHKSHTQFYLFIDLNKVGMLPLSYIKQLSNFFISKKDYTLELVICSSIILNNSAIRTLINGFFMIYTTIKPMKFVKTDEEAYTFLDSIKPGDTMSIQDVN
tara:strand:- start:3982 stop:4422 length:441 start_codon:yes stop_codon:yes gene_type:complete